MWQKFIGHGINMKSQTETFRTIYNDFFQFEEDCFDALLEKELEIRHLLDENHKLSCEVMESRTHKMEINSLREDAENFRRMQNEYNSRRRGEKDLPFYDSNGESVFDRNQ